MPHLSADPLISDPEGIGFLRQVLHGSEGLVRHKTEPFLVPAQRPFEVQGPSGRADAIGPQETSPSSSISIERIASRGAAGVCKELA